MTLGYESYIIVIVEKYNLKKFLKVTIFSFFIRVYIMKGQILRIVSNEYNNGNIPHINSTPLNSEKEFLYMKATGIVRRIEARVIITQKCYKAL